MKTSKRITAIAEMCHGARRVIDVGCDHGQLCAYLISNCAVEHAFASDLREGPLENAKRTIFALGLSEKISPVLCNGLEAFDPEDADTIIIAGMGGDETAAILERAQWPLKGKHSLVLQPMTASIRLRKWLKQAHCAIVAEHIVEENGKYYVIIQARGGSDGGNAQRYGYLFSEKILNDPLFPLYLHKLKEKYLKIADGQHQAGINNTQEQQCLQILLDLEREGICQCR